MAQETTPALQSVTFAVEGMSCGHCVRSIQEALDAHLKLAEREVDLEGGRLKVSFDPALASVEAIAQTMDEAGYPVSLQ